MTKPEIRTYHPGDEEAILELFSTCYQRELPLESWRWRFQQAPAGPGVIKLAWDHGQLVGHYAITPISIKLENTSIGTGLSGTTMTHPSYRGSGLFPQLARATYLEMRDRNLVMVWGFPNSKSHRGFIRDLGWTDLWEIPTLRAKLPLRIGEEAAIAVREISEIDERFDTLWREAGNGLLVAVERNRAWLTWRYLQNPTTRYRVLTAEADGALLGYLVTKRYKSEVHVVDLLALDNSISIGMLRAAGIEAKREGAETISLWLVLHASLHGELEKIGFDNEAPVTYFGASTLSGGKAQSLAGNFRNWYVTMGDSDVY